MLSCLFCLGDFVKIVCNVFCLGISAGIKERSPGKSTKDY